MIETKSTPNVCDEKCDAQIKNFMTRVAARLNEAEIRKIEL